MISVMPNGLPKVVRSAGCDDARRLRPKKRTADGTAPLGGEQPSRPLNKFSYWLRAALALIGERCV